MKDFKEKLKDFIEQCIKFSQNDQKALSGFFSIVDWMETADLPQIHEYLEGFSNEEYLNQLLTTGKVAFYYLLAGKDTHLIFNQNPSSVFKEVAERLKIYIKIWRGIDFSLLEPSEKQEGLLVNVFEYDRQFFWLVGDQDDDLERGKIMNQALYQETFIFNSESVFPQEPSSPTSIFANDILKNHPKLTEFLRTMAKVMVNDKLYSRDIQEKLELALNEVSSLAQISEIKELMNIKPLFCSIHQNSVFVSLFCRKKHCKICIYKIIKQQFSKVNFVIYCPCGIQIPPKNIHEMKKEHQYKEFSRNYKLDYSGY